MPAKIATCCYCGTRAALVLKGAGRRELSCASCGAPLHDLKHMARPKSEKPLQKSRPIKQVAATKAKSPKKKPEKKYKKRKGLWAKVLDEAWDAIEDVFD